MDDDTRNEELGKPIEEVRSAMLSRAYAYWNAKRGDSPMPARADLDPVDIPRLLPNIILMDVTQPDDRLKVRLVGTLVVTMFGSDYTGLFLDEIDFGQVREKILTEYNGAVTAARPLFSDHPFRKLGGYMFDIERVILPLSEDGRRVTMLLAVLDFTQRNDSAVLNL